MGRAIRQRRPLTGAAFSYMCSVVVVLWGRLRNPSPELTGALRSYLRMALPRHRPAPADAADRYGRRSELSPAEIRAFIDGYEMGKTAKELGAENGVSRQTVVRHLKAQGVTIRHQPMTAEDAARAAVLYRQGLSLADVGEALDRPPTAIRDVLERAGVPRRDSHGRERAQRSQASRDEDALGGVPFGNRSGGRLSWG